MPEEDLPDLPPIIGVPPLELPPIDSGAGSALGSGPYPPGTRPRPRPPIERPPIELPPGESPPTEHAKTILELIQEWFLGLPQWLRILLFVVAILLLIGAIAKFLKKLFGGTPPPGQEPPEELPSQVIPIAIAFNYDPTSPVALNIRRNASQEIEVPEWTLKDTVADESPAAYSIAAAQGNLVRIMVRLIIIPAIDAVVEVRAIGNGVLGNATRKEPVRFVKGNTIPEFIPFRLENHIVGSDGVRMSDHTWRWEFRLPGESNWHIIGETHHRIYEVLRTPDLPWSQSPYPDSQNPWTEVFDVACVWAAGARSVDEVAMRVTRAVNAPAGGVQYDMHAGRSHYTSSPGTRHGEFKCTDYLARIRNGAASGASGIVNCSDCAAFVSTFANAVGGGLAQSVMGIGFRLNPIIAIGKSSFGFPDWGPGFRYHEVAWWGNGTANEPLCDACLKTNRNGANPPMQAVLPVNTGFQNPYRVQLVPANDQNRCTPRTQYLQWRRVI